MSESEKPVPVDNPVYRYLDELPKEYRISDFHMRSGSPLAIRVNGEIQVMQDCAITHDMLDGVFRHELGDELYEVFDEKKDVDFAITVNGARFRANGYHTLKWLGPDLPHHCY